MYVVYLYYKRKKKFFYKFFLFCIFLETGFLGIKNQFSPFFSAISSPIGLKFFLVSLQVIWIGRFFSFLDAFYQSSLAGFAKFLGSKKPRDFAKCSVFSFSSLKYLEFLKKKHPPRLGPSTHSKNFSSNG